MFNEAGMWNRKTPKRGKYKPNEALFLALYGLHRDFEFEFCEAITDEDTSKNFIYYRFKRSDGAYITYFEPIQDADGFKENYPTLSVFLKIMAENDRKKIFKSNNEIIIVPLLQVQDRHHFNTLVFHHSKNKTHVYIVEPRSNNLTKWPRICYPVKKLIHAIRRHFPDSIIENPKIGLQSLTDDTTCGAHHINFTEIISHLKSDVITHTNCFKRALRRENLTRRDNDREKINFISSVMENENKKIEDNAASENKPELIYANNDKDKEKIISSEKDDMCKEFEDECEDDLKRDKSSYLDEAALNSAETQQAIHKAIRAEEQRRCEEALQSAIDSINAFSNSASQRTGFFKSSTRVSTANGIVKILNGIKQSEVEVETKNFHAALLLHFCQYAIGSRKSDLRTALETAMAKLLNCEPEYQNICATTPGNNNRFKKLNALFRHQLFLRGMAPANELQMYRYAKKIANIDSGWLYKLSMSNSHSDYKTRMNYERGGLIVLLYSEIRENIKTMPEWNRPS